jgi:hypothetical protein
VREDKTFDFLFINIFEHLLLIKEKESKSDKRNLTEKRFSGEL